MEARRVAILLNRGPGSVTRYPEIALAALATTDLEQARNFVQRRLGPLAAADNTSVRLRETLRAYLDEGASHGRAANRLSIHENTVRYRVRQAEDLLGRPVGPGDLDFRVALELAEASPQAG
jgi:DNA-binding PucR family transcriptional regulator